MLAPFNHFNDRKPTIMNAIALATPDRFETCHCSRPTPRPAVPSRRNPGATSPTLELVQACAAASVAGQRLESTTMVFLGACAVALLGGCAFHLERFVAHFDSFQTLVQAMLF